LADGVGDDALAGNAGWAGNVSSGSSSEGGQHPQITRPAAIAPPTPVVTISRFRSDLSCIAVDIPPRIGIGPKAGRPGTPLPSYEPNDLG
ncbi:MAG: hypothetical protein ACK55I_30880, partial [bacterium]